MHMILHALFGLVIGIVANYLLPGHNPNGLIITAIIGLIGGWLGGQIGKWFGWYKDGSPAGFGLSVVGAMIVSLIARRLL